MRFVWVDAGNNANWEAIARHGIGGEFYPVSDPVADVARRLVHSRRVNHVGGLYAAWNWIPNLGDGAGFAEWVHERVAEIEARLTPRPSNSFPKVQLDNEDHRPDVILAMLRRWRQLRPKRDTSWTFEAGQGGWMSPAFVDEVVSLRVRLVPQCYTGDMRRFESDVVLRDLTHRGFPESLVSPFYDAADLGLGWDGFAFTQGRLP